MKRSHFHPAARLCPFLVAAAVILSARTAQFPPARQTAALLPETISQALDPRREGPLVHVKKAWRLLPLFSAIGADRADPHGRPAAAGAGEETAGQPTLCVMGDTFGVRLYVEGVFVVDVNRDGSAHAAYDAGVRKKDILLAVDGHPVRRAEDVARLLDRSGGNEVELVCRRGDEEMRFFVRPTPDENGTYKAGLWLRDSVAGIGTMTYLDPATGVFGGLGHGICDPENGRLMPCREGVVSPVTVTGIVPGKRGKPGEVRGYLTADKQGKALANTECGVFGFLLPIPEGRQALPVADVGEVHEGAASLFCQLDEEAPREYALRITDVDRDCRGSKCFALEITDEALLDKTGGIIQGMSGSPIVQDGRLIGAVTHVLVSEPNKGYGIFIRNMLEAERQIG